MCACTIPPTFSSKKKWNATSTSGEPQRTSCGGVLRVTRKYTTTSKWASMESHGAPPAQANRARFSERQRLFIAFHQDYQCGICRNLLTAQYEIDHRWALCLGGDNELSNLQALCPDCHRYKSVEDIRRKSARHKRMKVVWCGGCKTWYSLDFGMQHLDCFPAAAESRIQMRG